MRLINVHSLSKERCGEHKMNEDPTYEEDTNEDIEDRSAPGCTCFEETHSPDCDLMRFPGE